MIRNRFLPTAFPVLLVALFLSACAVSLAPRYDPSLVDGLNKANEETLTLFSAVSGGSPSSEFSKYADRYDKIIGKFSSLRMQALARPTPPLAEKIADQLARFEILKEVCSKETGEPSACVNSSPKAMETIVDNMSRMRSVHEEKGLAADLAFGFKNSHEISIHQALTVETALKRD